MTRKNIRDFTVQELEDPKNAAGVIAVQTILLSKFSDWCNRLEARIKELEDRVAELEDKA